MHSKTDLSFTLLNIEHLIQVSVTKSDQKKKNFGCMENIRVLRIFEIVYKLAVKTEQNSKIVK